MCLRGVLSVATISSLLWSAFCHPGIAGEEEQLTEAMVRHSFEKTQTLEQPLSLAELGRQLRYACQAELDLPGMGGVADGGLGGPPTTHSLAAGECNQYLTSIFPDAVALLSYGSSDLEPQPSTLIDVAHLDARLSAAARFQLPTDTLVLPVQRLGDYLDYRSSPEADDTATRAVWGHAAGSARPGAGGHWPRSMIPLLVSHVFCGNDHVRWENEFRVARQRLATEILGVAEGATLDQPEEILGLTAAVASQAFLTDYAFYEDAVDLRLVEQLAQRLLASEDRLPEDSSAKLLIAACASYRATLPFVKSWASFPQWERAYLAERESSSASWPFWQLWRLAIAEPLREQELREELAPSDTQSECASGASVSCAVRTMYEQHPYPKWSRDPPPVRWPADPQGWLDVLGFVRPHGWPTITSTRPMKVLWAGCGTGYMLTLFARHFGGLVEIWAVDLSLASLAYASRRIGELGLTNVHFVQGDILVLPEEITSQSPFDFMESSGVIHHLEKPAEALASLVKLLRPGAALNLALYSTLARRDTVTPCREAGKTYNVSSDDSVREFRRMLIAMGEQATWASEIIRTEDFASLTGVRDLCLHPQERTFTLPQIGKLLNRVGLRWRRFAPTFSSAVPQLFQQRFGVDAFSKQATLKKWHDFEKENPHTFAAMYQFFVQKSCANGACGTNQEEL